jgi:PAS domain S-box-containing protein
VITLLLVDDDPGLLELTRLFIEKEGGIKIDPAISARLALEKLKKTRYDIIVSDYEMPEMDGIEFLKYVKEMGSDRPFIIFTGRSREDVVIRALNSGADFYLQKGGDPKVQFAELKNMIKHAVRKKRAEEALLWSEENYRTLVESTEDSIYLVDRELRYHFMNTHHQKRLGIPAEHYQNKPYSAFHTPDETERFATAAQHIFSTGLSLQDESEKDGRWFLRTFSPVKNEKTGQVRSVSIISTEITERKLAEEAIRRANEKLNFLSTVTRHDILNRLTFLHGYLQLAKELTRDEKVLEYMARQEEAVEAIGRLIIFTKDYRAVGTTPPEWQHIRIIAHTAVQNLEPYRITCTVNLDTVEIFADHLLTNVFSCLVNNALEHGEGITSLQFSYHETPRYLIVVCEDDGVGIPEHEKEKIFERGYGKGTGFGLFVAKEILGITGMNIRECGVPGRGAMFEIEVPHGMYRFAGNEEEKQVIH